MEHMVRAQLGHSHSSSLRSPGALTTVLGRTLDLLHYNATLVLLLKLATYRNLGTKDNM